MLQNHSVLPGDLQENVYVKKMNMKHLSPRTMLKTVHVWIKVFSPCLILKVRRKWIVNTWTDKLYQNWHRITSPIFFKGKPVPLPQWFGHGSSEKLFTFALSSSLPTLFEGWLSDSISTSFIVLNYLNFIVVRAAVRNIDKHELFKIICKV